ncbi:dihydrolipoamide acetyltransferase family protein [Halobacillus karajensis]|uniref:Dihydrolipoamide acetyltransferase component of pyruvate dehydrogenase complex n=1 Tax=Halobacillus karajensis TaxID=195088 RepID=A0A024P6K8_9BACI|nr:dihydrolipoamide acetyltransferase family protein [Halobacillus karajensis]CDQ17870.1 Dihydrolipoyllysine-residue acetyltransferase component of pyruvate dehydrogenase complex [Halobacillus karajensis]CDQ24276.1 Dihydrolipoyllysine-residue acetyltransferase component of pyruvate dehydrogenase complex [Halobacillus karajensis]CDQ29475.1 Dihydrolipoyllysine-residue acetyltransferase component of pyruvate dehydrogenase complex [Halobacillus karajensis]
MGLEKINMPQLGESVTEGTISTWLVQPGDQVNKYDPIAEVMTDKVNAEVPSSFSGTIKELVASEGDTISVGELMCYIEVEGAGASEEPAADENKEAPAQEEPVAEEKTPFKPKRSQEKGNKKRYSPAVMTLAQDHDIDLNQVEGSGRGGRITRKDIEKIIASGEIPKAGEEKVQTEDPAPKESAPSSTPTASGAQTLNVQTGEGDVEIPVTGVRKAIAANMVKSKTEIPHAWMMVEVDVTNLVELRNAKKTQFKQKEGFSLTYFAFFVKAVAQALKEYPQLNSTWAGDKIIQRKAINLNIAVAKDDELFVPVIKNADEKSIKGIAKDITDLANKARQGKLTSKDMEGGTFTVNNTGSFGSVQSMGVINHPQAAILQVESIVKKPVYQNGMFGARDMVNLCLSLDHRVLDGLVAGNFLARVKEILEKMSEDNTSVY